MQRGMPQPPSQQLAALLRAQIKSGELPPGTMLPSIVKLAEQHHVATNTVQKALGILKDEGLIQTVRGYGTFVREQ